MKKKKRKLCSWRRDYWSKARLPEATAVVLEGSTAACANKNYFGSKCRHIVIS